MNDYTSRQAAIDVLRTCYDTEVITYDNGNEYINYEQALDLMKQLPNNQFRINNQINLCDSCKYLYPACPSGEEDDVIFGNGIGNDNICACNKYDPLKTKEDE